MNEFLSYLTHWPLFLVLKIKTNFFKNKSALLWYDDAANFPNMNFFQLLAKRPYYREILYYRCSGKMVAILRHLYPSYTITVGNSNNGIPFIGDNVTVGCGAVIAGDIVVGDNVNIGANSVVVKNVPSNCTVVGNPAYIVKLNGERVNIKL